jgi:hypothetical protein
VAAVAAGESQSKHHAKVSMSVVFQIPSYLARFEKKAVGLILGTFLLPAKNKRRWP